MIMIEELDLLIAMTTRRTRPPPFDIFDLSNNRRLDETSKKMKLFQ